MFAHANRKAAIAPAVLLFLAMAASHASEPIAPDAHVQVAASVVVRVQARFVAETGPLGTSHRDTLLSNTGFFITHDGHVLTSLLAVAGCDDLQVFIGNGQSAPAHVVAIDQAAGLTLLKTDLQSPRLLEHVTATPEPHSRVLLAAASPQDVLPAAQLHLGTIDQTSADIRLQGCRWQGVYRTHLCAPTGSAAGPVLDDRGQLLGVLLCVQDPAPSSDAASQRSPAAPVAYILPAGQLSTIVSRLLKGESRRLGWLGVAIATEEGEPEGVTVGAVLQHSPAHAAGIRPGDVLLQIDRRLIENPADLASHVAERGPRPDVEVGLLRRGTRRVTTVKVDLHARPLTICASPRDNLTVFPGPGKLGLLPPQRSPSDPSVAGLIRENRRLQRRIEELEARLREPQP